MKRRKLLTSACYLMVEAKLELGVPLARIMRDMELDISRPALAKLISLHGTPKLTCEMVASLFPDWLIKDGAPIQEQPEGWKYVGYFPLGVWVNENN